MKQETKNKIEQFLKELHLPYIDILEYIDIEEIDFKNSHETIYDLLNSSDAFNIEIIYYYIAIEYLREYDCSISISIEIPSEYGYKLEDINSELLASLLASKNAQINYSNLKEEITEFFENLETE